MTRAAAVRSSLVAARVDILNSLGLKHGVLAAGWLVVAILPFVVGGSLPERAIAWIFYYALAAVGLNLVMGLGNMASIGHGAFLGLGALVAALLRSETSLSFFLAAAIAVVVTIVAAWLVGHGAVRLRAVKFAVSSWLGAWLMTLFLVSFPAISGGTGGIVVPEATVGRSIGVDIGVSPVTHYELGLVLLSLGLLVFRNLQQGSVGLMLATIKQNPREAAVIGTLRDDARLQVFVLGAALAGLAGAFGVQLSGLFDGSAYGVLLSVSLFVAVMLGGPGRVWAPILGAAVIAVLPLTGQPLIPLVSSSGSSGELLAGSLLLGVVALRATRPVLRQPSMGSSDEPTLAASRPASLRKARLSISGVSKGFGGLVALDGVDLEVQGGVVHGVIGPNGSGKSTLLSIISGHRFPSKGTITLDGADITSLPATDRLRLGIARSLQSTELFPEMTALEHLAAASLVDREYGGLVRTMARTPLARAEEARARVEAARSLADFGLTGYADTPASSIPSGARRTLMMAVAVAGRRVILLDEPSTGMSPAEIRRAAGMILELKERGAALVIVEHNMRLLGRVADIITVLDGGRVIAHGEPAHIYEHPQVRLAYLGRSQENSS